MRQFYLVVVLVLFALQIPNLSALGLGELKMESVLHQPLKAAITLNNIGTLDASQIKVKLAGKKEFSLAGVERTRFLTTLGFKVVINQGQGVVLVTSKDNVREPFLDFLVEIKWPAGKVVRAYTALVDLPTIQTPPPAVVSPVVKPSLPEPIKIQEVKEKSVLPASTYAQANSSTDLNETYRIKNNDTLWEIARAFKPSGSVTVQQTMLAIQKLNPQAFKDNNINRIRAGSSLYLPTLEQVNEFKLSKAIALVSKQNQDFLGKPIDASGQKTISAKPKNEPDGHLSLTSGGAKVVAAQPEEVTTPPPTDLSAQQGSNIPSADQTGEVKALQDQLNQLERIIELKNAELASMQQQLAEQKKLAEAQPQAAEPTKPTQENSSLLFGFNPLYLGLLALVLILLVIVFLMRKRPSTVDRLNENYVAPVADQVIGDDSLQPIAEFEKEIPLMASDEVESEDPASLTRSETDDPLSEADIYIAYGRYQQAIELLEDALQTAVDEDQILIKKKLLDIHFECEDQHNFLAIMNQAKDDHNEAIILYGQSMLDNAPEFNWLSTEISENDGGLSETNGLIADESSEFDFSHDSNSPLTDLDDELDSLAPEVNLANNSHETQETEETTDDELFTSSPEVIEIASSDLDDVTDRSEVLDDVELDFDALDFEETLDGDKHSKEITAPDLGDNIDLEVSTSATEIVETEHDELGQQNLASSSLEAEEDIDLADLSADDLLSLDDLELSLDEVDASDISQNDMTDNNVEDDNEAESLDAQLDALVKLSEESLDKLAEDAFLDPDEASLEEDLAFIASNDEVATKLDLARAYIEMGDVEGAKTMLEEVIKEGKLAQQDEARSLLVKVS